MKNILFSSIAGVSLLAFSLTVAGQDYYGDRGAFFHGEHWHAHLFEHVKQDVEHVRATTWPHGGDDFRLDKTIAELNELQGKFAHHVYDDRELGRVIDTLGRVASFNRMPPRDREMVNEDINHLREFREHHDDWFREHER